jgi:hypothetical protein
VEDDRAKDGVPACVSQPQTRQQLQEQASFQFAPASPHCRLQIFELQLELLNLALHLFRFPAKLQTTQSSNDESEPFDFSIMRRELHMLPDDHVLQRRSVQCVQIWQRRDRHLQNYPMLFAVSQQMVQTFL